MADNLVLLSAGLDSLVNLLIAMEEGGVDAAVTVDYGQRASAREIERARAACDRYGTRHLVLKAEWLGEISGDALTTPGVSLPAVEADDIDEGASDLSSVWVPNRNGLLVNMGACLAEAQGIPWVVMGSNAEEGARFPDNSRDFLEASNAALTLSTLSGVRLRSFTSDWDKKEILREALDRDLEFDLVWSCYNGGEIMCGRCESCARLLRAAGRLGVKGEISGFFREAG